MDINKRVSVAISANKAPPPTVKKGWLKKQGRSGMIKNWKTRYFVISQGMLNYYQEKIEEFPYGDVLKVPIYSFRINFVKRKCYEKLGRSLPWKHRDH